MKYLLLLLLTAPAYGSEPKVDYSLSGQWIICQVNLKKETTTSIRFYSKHLPGKIQYIETDYNEYKTYTVDFSAAYKKLKIDTALNPPIVTYLDKMNCKIFPHRNERKQK